MKIFTFFAVSVAALFFAAGASAHFDGSSWEETKGSFLIDIGYDTAAFVAGEYVRFDFSLRDVSSKDPRDFAQVWIRVVAAQSGTRLATGVYHQSIGPTTMLYIFDRPGEYSLEASFRDDKGTDLATSSMPITVSGFGDPAVPMGAVAGVAAVLFAAGLSFYLGRKTKPV